MIATLPEIERALSNFSLEQTEALETLVLRRKAVLRHPGSPDAALLQEFSRLHLPSFQLERMHQLRQQSESLGESERAELLELAGQEEDLAVRRVQIIGELAALREQTPREVMAQLGLLPGQ